MVLSNSPSADITVTADLVQQLLLDQHPEFAHHHIQPGVEGWDNSQFRLGDDLVVRLPRRKAAVHLIGHEIEWLPHLASHLSLPVPTPIRIGVPSQLFPHPWIISPWFRGTDALVRPVRGSSNAARQIAHFLRSLHRPAPDGAPRNPFRGIPLADRIETTSAALKAARTAGLLTQSDETAAVELWDAAMEASMHRGPPLWLHGDLHPGNIVIADGEVAAVIDWGDITAGDPACDLAVLWRLFDADRRAVALRELRPDSDTILRAQGWALAIGLVLATASTDRPLYQAVGLYSIREALGRA